MHARHSVRALTVLKPYQMGPTHTRTSPISTPIPVCLFIVLLAWSTMSHPPSPHPHNIPSYSSQLSDSSHPIPPSSQTPICLKLSYDARDSTLHTVCLHSSHPRSKTYNSVFPCGLLFSSSASSESIGSSSPTWPEVITMSARASSPLSAMMLPLE